MPPRPAGFGKLKEFGDAAIFYLSILPLAIAHPHLLQEKDGKKCENKDENKEGKRKDSQVGQTAG
jgi:hypothetical protein